MLAENQVHAFLEFCEAQLGRRLRKLRRDLGSKHKHGALWELVVLYSTARACQEFDHEPGTASPDVFVNLAQRGPIWIEARHLSSPDDKQSQQFHSFLSWIHLQLKHAGVAPSDFLLNLDSPVPGQDSVLPASQHWKSITRKSDWRSFLKALKQNKSIALSLREDGFSAIVKADYNPSPNGYLTSGFQKPTVVDELRKHPVHSAIEEKAKQAGKWAIGDAPLVLCLANTQQSQFFSKEFYPRVSPKQAALAALHDTSKWPEIYQANHVSRAAGQSHRVSGSRRVSGVLLVTIEDSVGGVLNRKHRRLAEMCFIRNRESDFPLSAEQEEFIQNLPFTGIHFGHDAEIDWAIRRRRDSIRSPHAEKTMKISGLSKEGFSLELPQQDLVWLLSGKKTASEWIRNYGVDSPFEKLLSEEPPIQSIELLPGDAEKRIVDTVRIAFGPPKERLY